MKFLIVFLFSLNVFALTSTTFNPSNSNGFSKDSMAFAGQKIMGVAAPLTTTNIDFPNLTDVYLLTGADAKAVGACEADEIKFQVMAGTTVVSTFIDWYMIDSKIDKDLTYPAKLEVGLKLRVVYKNTCTTNVNVYVNYNLHKVTAP